MSRKKKYKTVTASGRHQTPAEHFVQHAFASSVKFVDGSNPKILITPDAYSRMWHYVDVGKEEVGWLGTVRILSGTKYLIEDVYLLEQKVSAAQTEISGAGIAKIGQHLIDTYPEDGIDRANRIRFWGHSHVNMHTAASHQDEKQMDLFKENGCTWFIRGILNKRGRMEFSIFLWNDGITIELSDIPWEIYSQIDYSFRKEIEAEFKQKVRERRYYTPRYSPPYVYRPHVVVTHPQPQRTVQPTADGYEHLHGGNGVALVYEGPSFRPLHQVMAENDLVVHEGEAVHDVG